MQYNNRCIDHPENESLKLEFEREKKEFTSIRNAVRIFDRRAKPALGHIHVHILSPARLYSLHSKQHGQQKANKHCFISVVQEQSVCDHGCSKSQTFLPG